MVATTKRPKFIKIPLQTLPTGTALALLLMTFFQIKINQLKLKARF